MKKPCIPERLLSTQNENIYVKQNLKDLQPKINKNQQYEC